MSTIIGHEQQIEYFEKVIKRGQLAHAYLFHGPSHVGKLTMAKALAKSLCCNWTKKNTSHLLKSCGECQSCREIEENRHPDVILLDPEHTLVSDKERRKEIPIEDIRELKRIFSLATVSGHWHVGIINEAERLSVPASNALLKLLEEPGARTIFFLIAESIQTLLPTVVSRTQRVRFSLVSRKIMEQWLAQETTDLSRQEEILSLSFQRPGVMVQLSKEPDQLQSELKFYKDFNTACRGGVLGALSFIKPMADKKEQHDKFIRYLFAFLQNALHGNSRANMPATNEIVRMKKVFSMLPLLKEANVNQRLALDVMMLEALGY